MWYLTSAKLEMAYSTIHQSNVDNMSVKQIYNLLFSIGNKKYTEVVYKFCERDWNTFFQNSLLNCPSTIVVENVRPYMNCVFD